jgi:XRE family aerobic/anaerobic benzoate catabolism transcriptional regulator
VATNDVLVIAGVRVRELRGLKRWTIRELAERSGVSLRFLVQLEGGRANISLRRLADIATALGVSPAALLSGSGASGQPKSVALLGPRGAGKTTIGRALARQLRAHFIELDRRIEQEADLSLGQIFSLHGEEYYRRLERGALADVLAEPGRTVLATGGGIVTSPASFALLKSGATTIWLRASAEEHWNRVVAQGDRRPMADHPQAMADLRALLASRQPLYATATHTVETTGRRAADVVDEIRGLLAR